MSGKVNTVSGPADVCDLGITLMHEHMVFGYPGFQGDMTLGIRRKDAVDLAVKAVEQAKAYGVKTIVDATPNECGRDPQLLKEISERTQVQLICSTGYYFEKASSPEYIENRIRKGTRDIVEEVYEMMVAEITQGIADTGVRAGVIKVASGNGAISEYEKIFFKAAARAQRQTGVPIITHTENGTMGRQQADLLLSEGAVPDKIMIGHMCGNRNLQDHLALLQKGVSVSFDRFGQIFIPGLPSDEERVSLLAQLVKMGFTNQLFLSHDKVNVFWGRPLDYPPQVLKMRRRHNLALLFSEIIPSLAKQGVSEKDVETILVKNPARLFS